MICPCKDCPKKGCGAFHDKCESYQEWVKEKHIVDEQLKMEKRKNRMKW